MECGTGGPPARVCSRADGPGHAIAFRSTMTRRATRRRTSAASARPCRDRFFDGALNAERRHLFDEVPGTARGTLQLLLVALVADQVLEVLAAVQAPVFVDRHDCVTAFRLPAPPGFRLLFTPPLRRSSTVFCWLRDIATARNLRNGRGAGCPPARSPIRTARLTVPQAAPGVFRRFPGE